MIFLSTLLLAVLITIATTPVLSMLAIRFGVAVDLPGERKVHSRPIPRIGGVAMAIGAFVPLVYWLRNERFVLAYLAGAAVLVIFGMLDDMYDLSPKIKFAGQIIAALIVMTGGEVRIDSLGMLAPEGFQLPAALAIPLTLFAIVGVTNAINLSDGLDGLAGGISLLIFAAIGYLAYLEGDQVIGLVALALTGVLFGFLRYNTYPATIFMGDAGSQLLGFSAAALSIALTQKIHTLSQVLPLLLLGFPLLDTITVMFARIAKGRSPFRADKNHFHHHLITFGLQHAESVMVIYIFQTLLIISALLLRYYSDWLLLGEYLAFSAITLFIFHRARREGLSAQWFDIINLGLSSRLRLLKRNGTVIRRVFPFFVYGVPLLLLATCCLVKPLPGHLTAAALLAMAVIGLVWTLADRWLDITLRVIIYLLVPFAIYLSETGATTLTVEAPRMIYNTMFGLFAVMIMIITKFSRRKGGFKSSPMDFLIIILAVAVPNLPSTQPQEYHYGLVAAKVIMLYFSFEVLLGELRGKYNFVAATVMLSLLMLVIR